jgi:hypothetical protein
MIVRKPAIKVITTGSSWKKQVGARRLSRLLSGMHSVSGLEAATPSIYRDSCRCQVAASKWAMDENGKLTAERALPHTIIYNPASGPNPREIFQRHGLPRGPLAKRYPVHAAEIMKLPSYRADPAFHVDIYSYQADQDLVEVVEGWRKPVGKDEGRYVMTAGSLILEDEEWDLPVFPLVPLTYGESYSSLAGNPLGRQILPFQLKLNRMNRVIDENAVKCGPPKIAIPKGSEVEEVTNMVAERFYYNAAAGEVHWIPGQMLPPQYYAEKEATKAAAYEFAGISQSVAQAQKEKGLPSAQAQRDIYDKASGRLVLDAEKLERWFEENSRVALAMMRKAYGKKSQRIMAPNTRLLEEIDWSEVGDVAEDEIEIRGFITSAIPNAPAGRAERLAEWVEAGAISQQRSIRWYANPDLASLEDEESAAEDLARKMIDSALIDADPISPDPIMGSNGLQLVIDIGGEELMKAMTLPEPPPEENMELLRRLIEEAKLLVTPPPAPAAPAPAPPAPGPETPRVSVNQQSLLGAQSA